MLFRNLFPFFKCKVHNIYPLMMDQDEFKKRFPDYLIGQPGNGSIDPPLAAIVCPACQTGAIVYSGPTYRKAADDALYNWNWEQTI